MTSHKAIEIALEHYNSLKTFHMQHRGTMQCMSPNPVKSLKNPIKSLEDQCKLVSEEANKTDESTKQQK